jgi:Ca-activated chloride channel family protein
MKIIFENIYYLLPILILIPLIVIIHFSSLKFTKRKALKFANFEAIERVSGTEIISKNLVLLYTKIAIVLLIFFSLSGPSFFYTGLVPERNFVLAIDSSYSMLSNDILPSRLEAAKEAATSFVDTINGQSKIGVVSFSGASFIELMPSNEMARVKQAISNIEKKEVGGTDISGAIITSINLMKDEKNDKKGAVILLTDGQINIGSVDEIIKYSEGTAIYSIGIGTEKGGEFMPEIVSKIDEEKLIMLANSTNGKYYKADTREKLNQAYLEIANMKKGNRILNLAMPLLILAIVLIIIDFLLSSTKYRTLP